MWQKISLLAAVIMVLGSLAYYTFRYQWPKDSGPAVTVGGGDWQRGRQAILDYGCSGCHVVSFVRQATGRVGPKLEDIREQIYLAGVLPNQPDNMIQWLLNPRQISPRTAMPNLEVTEQDARDIGAFLYQPPRRGLSRGGGTARDSAH